MLGSALVEVQIRGHVIQAPTPRMQQVLQLVQKQRPKTRAMAGGGMVSFQVFCAGLNIFYKLVVSNGMDLRVGLLLLMFFSIFLAPLAYFIESWGGSMISLLACCSLSWLVTICISCIWVRLDHIKIVHNRSGIFDFRSMWNWVLGIVVLVLLQFNPLSCKSWCVVLWFAAPNADSWMQNSFYWLALLGQLEIVVLYFSMK